MITIHNAEYGYTFKITRSSDRVYVKNEDGKKFSFYFTPTDDDDIDLQIVSAVYRLFDKCNNAWRGYKDFCYDYDLEQCEIESLNEYFKICKTAIRLKKFLPYGFDIESFLFYTATIYDII